MSLSIVPSEAFAMPNKQRDGFVGSRQSPGRVSGPPIVYPYSTMVANWRLIRFTNPMTWNS